MISPSLKLVIQRTLPLTLGMFAIMLVQLVDSIFIGMLGVDQLAVHGITLPFQAVIIGLQVGVGVAATSIISQACGAKQSRKAQTIATISVGLGSLFVALVCLLLWTLQTPIFSAFTAADVSAQDQQLLQSIFRRYWPIWLLSATSVATLYLITCVYRANQDTKTTGQMFLLASIINLILDPILIFTFNLGIVGAAIASTIGYGYCALVMLYKARDKQWFGRIPFGEKTKAHTVELVRFIIPTIINQSLPSLSAFACMLLIAQMGTNEIAFWGLLSRIESFMLVFTLALTMALPPIIGRYLGQGKNGQISELLITTGKFLIIFHIIMAVVVGVSSALMLPLLSADITIQLWFSRALWLIPISYGPLGLCMIAVSVFNALGQPKKALVVSCVRLILLYIPAIWLGASTGNVLQAVTAATIANTLAGAYAWLKLKQYTQSHWVKQPLTQT